MKGGRGGKKRGSCSNEGSVEMRWDEIRGWGPDEVVVRCG